MSLGATGKVTTLLVMCVLGLLAVGLVMLYSVAPYDHSTKFLLRQLIACGIGLVAAAVLAALDYRLLRRWSPIFLLVAGVMLILVLVPGIGYKTNGARRWFRFMGFQFQPSDFAKLAILIFLANYGATWQRYMGQFKKGILTPLMVVGVLLGLMFLEPDWGTALLLAAVSSMVLMIAGARWAYLMGPALAGLLVVGTLLFYNPVRSDRIYSWLHVEQTKAKVGYQAWQARVALGTGGLTGVGLNSSTQKRLLSEFQTDFIFAIIGEEFGYAGSVVVLAAFTALVLCGLHIASRAADMFGLLLGAGISLLLGMQALINVGVVSSALPNKGLALPFISYGGSNLIVMLCCIGILLSIARHSSSHSSELSTAEEVAEAPLGQAV